MKVSEAITNLESLLECVDNKWYEISLDDADGEALRIAISMLKFIPYKEDEILAKKIWLADDVRDCLIAEEYEGTDDEVAAVIDTGELKYLNDCTDRDWEIIACAIHETRQRGDIVPLYLRGDDDNE